MKIKELKEVIGNLNDDVLDERALDYIKENKSAILKEVGFNSERVLEDGKVQFLESCICGYSEFNDNYGKTTCPDCGRKETFIIPIFLHLAKEDYDLVFYAKASVSANVNEEFKLSYKFDSALIKEKDSKKMASGRQSFWGFGTRFSDDYISSSTEDLRTAYSNLMSHYIGYKDDEESIHIFDESAVDILNDAEEIITKREEDNEKRRIRATHKSSSSDKSERQKIGDYYEVERRNYVDVADTDYDYVKFIRRDEETVVVGTKNGTFEVNSKVNDIDYRNRYNRYAIQQELPDSVEYAGDVFKNHIGATSVLRFSLTDDNNLFISAYDIDFRYDFEESLDIVPYVNYVRGAVAFMKNGFVILDSYNNTLRKNSYGYSSIVTRRPSYIYQDLDDIYSLIEESNQDTEIFKRLLDISIQEIEGTDNLAVNPFAYAQLIEHSKSVPVLESLYKTGFTNLANDLLETRVDGNNNASGAKSIYDLMGFKEKEFMEFLKEINPKLKDFDYLCKIRKVDRKRSPVDEYRWLYEKELHVNAYSINELLHDDSPINNLTQIREYLESVLNNQCYPYAGALRTYTDYIRMGVRLSYNFKNKSILYPDSLKREHDIADFSIKAIEDEVVVGNFNDSVDEYRHLEYKDKKTSMLVKVPDDAKEVIREGKDLHHCVGNYVNSIKNGSSRILFIRKMKTEDVPYYTVEVDDKGTVTEISGLMNDKATLEVKQFVQNWAKKRNLEIPSFVF